MNGMLNENFISKKYEFDKPTIQKVASIIDDCIRDCQHKYFHTFDHICVYNFIYKNISNNETAKFTISDKSMALYELNKELPVARANDFIYIQINKLT